MLDRLDRAMRHVEPDWTPGRAASGLRRLEQRQRPGRRGTILALTVAGVAGAAAIFLSPVLRHQMPPAPPAPVEARLTFRDGTTVQATVPATELRVVEDTPARQVVQIVRGGARFDVAPTPGRTFRVQLRDVMVEVLGTVFRVEEVGARVRVAVERGRVRVQLGADRRELAAGQILELPSPDTALPRVVVASAAASNAWPPAAARGADGPVRKAESSAGLLAAADRARRAGQPRSAMRRLRTLVARFPDDARAPLAAFTLGLLALGERRPEEAAQAFALTRRLAPAGELAEDALAREVQAWYEAGQQSTANARATEYQRLYPSGRRAGSVRQLGGLR